MYLSLELSDIMKTNLFHVHFFTHYCNTFNCHKNYIKPNIYVLKYIYIVSLNIFIHQMNLLSSY